MNIDPEKGRHSLNSLLKKRKTNRGQTSRLWRKRERDRGAFGFDAKQSLTEGTRGEGKTSSSTPAGKGTLATLSYETKKKKKTPPHFRAGRKIVRKRSKGKKEREGARPIHSDKKKKRDGRNGKRYEKRVRLATAGKKFEERLKKGKARPSNFPGGKKRQTLRGGGGGIRRQPFKNTTDRGKQETFMGLRKGVSVINSYNNSKEKRWPTRSAGG